MPGYDSRVRGESREAFDPCPSGAGAGIGHPGRGTGSCAQRRFTHPRAKTACRSRHICRESKEPQPAASRRGKPSSSYYSKTATDDAQHTTKSGSPRPNRPGSPSSVRPSATPSRYSSRNCVASMNNIGSDYVVRLDPLRGAKLIANERTNGRRHAEITSGHICGSLRCKFGRFATSGPRP
jgi:hypothetical protein